MNVKDVSSSYAKQRKGITLERLDKYDREEGCWQEILIEDRNSTPADLAASRIDFLAWLATLSRRDRKIALKLATGESTRRTARQFGLSKGRISQMRGELRLAWEQFTGEGDAVANEAA